MRSSRSRRCAPRGGSRSGPGASSMNSCPSSGRITPPTIFPRVDFPAPLAPTSACAVPPATSTLTSSSALVPDTACRPIRAGSARPPPGSSDLCSTSVVSGPGIYSACDVQSRWKSEWAVRYGWSMIAGRVAGLTMLTRGGVGFPFSAFRSGRRCRSPTRRPGTGRAWRTRARP